MARKTFGSKGEDYRRATYRSAVRMARLVDEMPRHGIGRRFESVAEGLGVSEQTIKRYVKALNAEFTTDHGSPQFLIERRGDEERLVKRSRYDERARADIHQLISRPTCPWKSSRRPTAH